MQLKILLILLHLLHHSIHQQIRYLIISLLLTILSSTSHWHSLAKYKRKLGCCQHHQPRIFFRHRQQQRHTHTIHHYNIFDLTGISEEFFYQIYEKLSGNSSPLLAKVWS
jgi:hypothetical protein